MTIKMTRRGIIGGLVGLVAAPVKAKRAPAKKKAPIRKRAGKS